MWYVFAAALIMAVVVVLWSWSGFSFQIGRFFAMENPNQGEGGAGVPTASITVTPSSIGSGGTVNVSWSSSNATSCVTTAGTFSTGDQTSGSTTDTISPGFSGTAQFRIRCTGPGGSVDSNIAYVTVTAGGGGATATPSSACGPTIPEGGQLDWSFRTSEPWDDCAEGQSNANAEEFTTYVTVGTCHPDNLHLVWRAAHRPKATCAMKDVPVDREFAEGQGIKTSVVNFNNMDLPNGMAGSAQMTYTTSTVNCGSIDMYGAFWATDPAHPDVYVWNNTGNAGYHKIINYGKDCTTSGSPLPSPSPVSPTPAVSVAPLQCAPSSQAVGLNEPASVQATGGTGVFTWTTNGNGVQTDGGPDFAAYSYNTTGSKIITVKSGGLTAFCTVVVQSVSTTPTASPGGSGLTVIKEERDITQGGDFTKSVNADSGDVVQFRIRITSAVAMPVIVRDALPRGMSYRGNSTTVNGSLVADTITDSGVQTDLIPGEEVVVTWAATADQLDSLPSGLSQSQPRADVLTPSGSISDSVYITLLGTGSSAVGGGTGAGAGVGSVSTGPGDAVVLALMGSAIVTLLYSAYTRSSSFRRKEVQSIAEKRDPMDFRS